MYLSVCIKRDFPPTYMLRANGHVDAQGVGMTAVTAGVELFPTKHRVVTSGFWSTLFWALCIMSLAPVAYALRFFSWRAVQVAATLSAVVVIIQVVYVNNIVTTL